MGLSVGTAAQIGVTLNFFIREIVYGAPSTQ